MSTDTEGCRAELTVNRRRVHGALLALLASGVLVLGACAADPGAEVPATPSLASGPTTPSLASGPATPAVDPVELPEGWRWEGFAGVMVAVPRDWGWGNGSQRLGQWCVGQGPKPPIIGRPGAQTAVACPPVVKGVEASTLVANTGIVAALEWAFEDDPPRAQGDQQTLRVGDVIIRVNAPESLGAQVLATAHEAEVDQNGCPMHLPESFAPGDRPEEVRAVETLTGVTAVSACSYELSPLSVEAVPPPLYTSLLLEGEAARAAVAAIAEAPLGGGPDKPSSCLPAASYGTEMIVARITGEDGVVSTVHVHYSGCDHNGFDDGVALRSLTRAAIQPLIAEPNSPRMWGAPEAKTRMLEPSAR